MQTSPENASSPLVLPVRKKLPHNVPFWVPQNAVYFITIGCNPRHENHLARPEIADAMGKSLLHYQNIGKCWVWLFLLMPDHAHGLVTFTRKKPIKSVVEDWKRWHATQTRVRWQVGFFEARIRDRAMLVEKRDYIRNNPVAKKLVEKPDDWPYQWHYGCAKQQPADLVW